MPYAVHWLDLQFITIPHKVVAFGGGVSATVFERVGVPKIPPQVLNAIFYLYRNADDAEVGRDPGGTGFILGWTHESLGMPLQYYAVTNWHVACKNDDPDDPPCPVIRFNTKFGTTKIVNLKPDDWKFQPNGNDIAVVPIDFDVRILEWSYVSTDMFGLERHIDEGDIAVGDDVFMAGLFFDHSGEEVNVPSARFGNVSVLPNPLAPISQITGLEAPAYVIDMHSRSGFSGSPVFVYRTPGQDLSRPAYTQWEIKLDRNRLEQGPLTQEQIRISGRVIFAFLGIHFGQFPERMDKIGFSGMTTVIPAWEIINLLNGIPELVAMREEKMNKRLSKRPKKSPVPEKQSPQENGDANPNHLDDFKRLVDVAARKRPQGDRT